MAKQSDESSTVKTKPKKKRAKKEKVGELTNILVDCDRVGHVIPTATEILSGHVASACKAHKDAPCLSAIPYNEGIQFLAKYSDKLLDELKENNSSGKLDTKLPLDAAVYSWIFQLNRQSEFAIFK